MTVLPTTPNGTAKRISHQYGYTNTGCIYSISQSLACRTGFPYSQIKDRDTPHVSFTRKRIEAHICICFVALKVYKELERMLKVSEIKMSVDKVLALAKTITTIQIKQPMNKEVYTQTMLMARHQKIAKLFDEDFWVTR